MTNVPPPPPPAMIFNAAARAQKRRRAREKMHDHDFLHVRAAEDIVDRLEVILKRFEQALFCGPAAPHVAARLTEAANVGQHTLCDELEGPGIDIVAPPAHLPFEDRQFDLVVSALALHAIEDFPQALVEARRVLKPDGLFLGIFPGERSLAELREVLSQAEAHVTGRGAPRILPLVAVKDGGALLQRAGFALPVADVLRVPLAYSTLGRLFEDLRGTGETSHLAAGPKGAFRRDVLAAVHALYTEKFPAEGGGLAVTVDLVTVTGWAPHASQQQPLKPGSAKASMADAVKKMQSQAPED